MNNWQILLLSSSISLVVAWVTSHFAYKSEMKKYLYIKRELLYFELYEHLDKFLMDVSLVYDVEYKKILYSFKPRVKLVGSKSVINGYKELINIYNKFVVDYERFNLENNPMCDEKLYENRINEDGEEYEIFHGTKQDNDSYTIKVREYTQINLPDNKKVSELINRIVNAMRSDLGNSKVKLVK